MRCWAEINIQNLYDKISEIEKIVNKDKIIAVLKADAYGHGMMEICKEYTDRYVDFGFKKDDTNGTTADEL